MSAFFPGKRFCGNLQQLAHKCIFSSAIYKISAIMLTLLSICEWYLQQTMHMESMQLAFLLLFTWIPAHRDPSLHPKSSKVPLCTANHAPGRHEACIYCYVYHFLHLKTSPKPETLHPTPPSQPKTIIYNKSCTWMACTIVFMLLFTAIPALKYHTLKP